MIQTINPYASARTAEIMSRYRPIAPKPEAPSIASMAENSDTQNGTEKENSGMPQSIRKSAYLRDVWAHLQARPTRTRKRGRSAAFPPPPMKRSRSSFQEISTPFKVPSLPATSLAMHGFSHTASGFSLVPINCGLDAAVTTLAESVALPLLHFTTADAAQIPVIWNEGKDNVCRKEIDLNMEADEGPKELDFMLQLKQPVKGNIITPQPVRPVGSNIVVKNISAYTGRSSADAKRPDEVEDEIEGDAVPTIISDSNNKVRVANAAYKEMVGQPECCWLDCVSACGGGCKRIGGEILLQFCCDTEVKIMSMHGFTSQVEIAWESEGKKRSVNGSCDVVKVGFEEKNCKFLWRFHTSESPKTGSESDNG
ncbi:hypothetical protein F511_01327 [Dorcoceras hygrometricum]|uniref:DUF7950 domain-containing protein n=1 Tax=Dorcoceras hygrometricum TaxID=472368 RepID=A0A2Z7D7J4_9LAMI|nr:hypothetical protein F511_01327 [Dorcoceras hygrometricum]